MLNLKRAGFVGACCVAATAVAPLAVAAGTHKAKAIKATQRLTILSAGGSRVTDVGTSDGTIAGAGVHGALRAVVIPATPPKFVATGTLFYPTGTLRYTLKLTITSGPSGSLRLSGTGEFTGGTGSYTGARGTFTGSGTKPANSFETFRLTGNVSYR